MTSIPTYGEIAQKYRLDPILIGGDLQVTASGDIALTADGDLKFGNDKCNAMHRLVQRWSFSAASLETLFALVVENQSGKRRAEAEREAVAGVLFQDVQMIEKFHALRDEIGAREFGSAAYAGAIIVVLNNLLMRFRSDLADVNPPWVGVGPMIAGRSFGEIVAAGANNFRHHDEWARTKRPTQQQRESISVLIAVLAGSNTLVALVTNFRRNVCAELLELISGDDFGRLSLNFFSFAKAMVV